MSILANKLIIISESGNIKCLYAQKFSSSQLMVKLSLPFVV